MTNYVYLQTRDICGTQSVLASCQVNGTYVPCPGIDWVEDWWSLGDDW
jgi:hypothetical protein